MKKFLFCGSLLFALPQPSSAIERSWQTLMHYQPKSGSAWESTIDEPTYFLAENGRWDPTAEWSATEKALNEKTIRVQGKDWDPVCAFPARQILFEEKGLVPARSCQEFEVWQKQFQLRSLSLVFSTAYAGNSASMFGHTLLKLNREASVHHDLLDYGLAFMAQANPEDSAAIYTYKGLSGGYPGYFLLQPYYQLVNQYAFSENRDLWELEIPLNDSERKIFLAHLWEILRHGRAAYYFTHVNCSTMLAEVLDAVKTDWHVRDQLHGFILPSELMRVAGRMNSAPSAMVFRPSQRHVWQERLNKLSEKQKALFRETWKSKTVDVAANDSEVLDAILDRITIEKSRLDLPAQVPLRKFEGDVLLARSTLPASAVFVAKQSGNNPLLGHSPAQVSLLGGQAAEKAYWGLRLRWGWHDLLDPAEGFESHYHLNVLDIHWQRDEADEQEARLKIAEVWSLSPWSIDDPLWSWILAGGADGETNRGIWRQRVNFEASAGLSFGSARSLFSFLPGVQTEQPLTDSGQNETRLRLSILYLQRWTHDLRSLFRFLPNTQMGTGDRVHADWDGEVRWDLRKGWQAELRVARGETLRWEVGAARSF